MLSDKQKELSNDLVFSYLTLRNLIGICGMLLPFLLFITTGKIEPSISDYFYTKSGDILVVSLSIIGVFLFTYNGYGWAERILTTIAALSSIAIAFCPTASVREHAANSI